MARKVTVTLTAPQAEALWAAARYVLDLDPDGDGPEPTEARVLKNAQAKLGDALDAREA
jgi:hypothetical protein